MSEPIPPAPLRVSILLANFNHAAYLPESLAGIAGQTRPADEIILVDDGSSDGSLPLLERFAADQSNVRLLRNEENRGLLFSIARALESATGDYVVWAASDDRLLPAFLDRSVALLARHPGAGVCFSRLAVFQDDTGEEREYDGGAPGMETFDLGTAPHFLSPDDLRRRLQRSYLWMSGNTLLARRDRLLALGGFPSALRWHAEWFVFYVLALRDGACVLPETLALMRERPGTWSATGMQDAVQQRAVLRALVRSLGEPSLRDVREDFRRFPSLFTPLQIRQVLAVLATSPKDLDLFVPFARWFLQRQIHRLGRGAQRTRFGWRPRDP